MKGFIVLVILVLGSCNSNNSSETNENNTMSTEGKVPLSLYTMHQQHPHNTLSFTEGLFVYKNKLYESTGSPEELPNTKSLLGIVDTFGNIKPFVELDKKIYFGEGISILNGKIYQLTYKNQTGFIYDAETFKGLGTFHFMNKEGWGLTSDTTNLILGDGTNKISFIDPESFKIIKEILVTDNKSEVVNINELEFVRGFIYANIYTTNIIVKIDPLTGKIVKKFNLDSLYNIAINKNPSSLEMNGIAFNPVTNHFLVTGKMWPYIFEISLD